MADQDSKRIRIARDGFELEIEGDRAFIDDMLDRYLEVPPSGEPTLRPSGGGPGTVDSSARDLSASEFIRKLGVKKHTDRALAFGFFIEHNRDQSSFTTSDINALYYEAKMEPTNTSATFAQLVKRGHIMEAKAAPKTKGAAKSYTLTQSGVEFIEEALSAGGS